MCDRSALYILHHASVTIRARLRSKRADRQASQRLALADNNSQERGNDGRKIF